MPLVLFCWPLLRVMSKLMGHCVSGLLFTFVGVVCAAKNHRSGFVLGALASMVAQCIGVASLGLSVKAVAHMIVLASGSPRRRELLTQVGLIFSVQVFEIDESCLPNEAPDAYVCRLAQQKARAAQAHLPADCTVIAADTTVTVDGQILGKPTDREDAFAMWRLLSGRSHKVMTGVAGPVVSACCVLMW
jgi:hypothetical protein